MKSYTLEKSSSKVSVYSNGPKVNRDIVIRQNSGFQSVLIVRKTLDPKKDIITTADIFFVDTEQELIDMIDCQYSIKYPLLTHKNDARWAKQFHTANDAIRASVIKLDTPDYRGRQHRIIVYCNEDDQFSVYSAQQGVN